MLMAMPATNRLCTSISTGRSRIVDEIVAWPRSMKASKAASRTGMARAKCTRCDSTTTSGRASAGNMTFLISPAFAVMALVDSSTAAEKNVHGQNWLKRSACPLNSGKSGCC